jgi:hypothetical protein
MERLTLVASDTDATILEFVRTQFQVPRTATRQHVREAAEALARANPQLADQRRVAAGERILVPGDFAFPRKPGSATEPPIASEQAALLSRELAARRRAVRPGAGQAIAELDSSLQTLDAHRDVLMRYGMEEEIDLLPRRIEAERQATETIADVQSRALRQLEESLAEFSAFRGSTWE